MLSEPEDYGLSPSQTLAHRADSVRPAGFDRHWRGFREAIELLSATWHQVGDGPVSEVVIPSMRSVRVVARLACPRQARGAVITTHGYQAPDVFDATPWYDPPASGEDDADVPGHQIVLQLRARGYPPSILDTGDLRGDWILHNLGSATSWVLGGAVADLIQAYRCLRRRVGPTMGISLHGESFGGGLAVIAAAQLTAMGDPPHRLAIGLPSFGDWRWRSDRYCNGAGAHVNMMLEAWRDQRDELMHTLLLHDAALHAPDVIAPTLCKLALRDDTVPAPTASAIYNAIGSTDRWRFLTRYGHFDGGLADARRHVRFQRGLPDFTDPGQTAAAAVAQHGDEDESQLAGLQ